MQPEQPQTTIEEPQHLADSVQRFAADLRELKHANGNPTLKALEAQTHVSKSVLSEAFSGHRLPTANTVEKLARALGDDARTWARRRAALANSAGVSETESAKILPAKPKPRTARWVMLTIALVVSFAVLPAVWFANSQAEAAQVSRAVDGQLPVIQNADPLRTVCMADAHAATTKMRADGHLMVIWVASESCGAYWASAYVVDGGYLSNELTIRVYPKNDPYSGLTRPRTARDAAAVRSGLFIPHTFDTPVCATVSGTLGGAAIEFGDPVCYSHDVGGAR